MDYYKNLDLENIVYFCEFDLIWKEEQWKDLIDYEGIYKISDLGRIKRLSINKLNGRFFSVCKEKILKQSMNGNGYHHVSLSKNGTHKTIRIHPLVALVFLNHKSCGHKLVINHIDINSLNNKLSNLEIVTNRENCNRKHIKSTSVYTGVSWDKSKNKWRAEIRTKNKNKGLGYFINEIDAHNAYQSELKKINEKTTS